MNKINMKSSLLYVLHFYQHLIVKSDNFTVKISMFYFLNISALPIMGNLLSYDNFIVKISMFYFLNISAMPIMANLLSYA